METANFIDSENVALCPINPDHFPLFLKWKNDPKLREFNCNRAAATDIEQLKREIQEPRPVLPESFSFEIYYKPENKLVGQCGLHSFAWRDGRAQLGIVIGEREYWGRGIGTEAYQLLVRYGFTQLELHKIVATINAPNIGSQTAVQRAGLTIEAQLKEWTFTDGKYYDRYIYGITEDEWRALNEY